MTETVPNRVEQSQECSEISSDTPKFNRESQLSAPSEGETSDLDAPRKTEIPNQNASKQPDSTSGKTLSAPTGTGSQGDKQAILNPEQQLGKVRRELENMVIRYAQSEAENLQNKAKSKEFESKLQRAIKDNESLANRIKILTSDKNQLTDTLSAKVAQLTVLEQKNCSLSNVQDTKLKELQKEVEELRRTNEDLVKSIDTYKVKENELLDFSERLSMKHLLLQGELDKALANEPDYKKQFEQLAVENGNLVEEIGTIKEKLRLSDEALIVERKSAERLKLEVYELEMRLKQKIEEYEHEMKLMTRKHLVVMAHSRKHIRRLQVELEKVNDPHNGNKLKAS